MSVVSNLMVMALNQVGPASPEGQDLLKAINLVGKHVPPGSASPAQQMNQLRALMMRQVQMAPQVAQMQHQAASQMAAGQPMAGAPPQPQAA